MTNILRVGEKRQSVTNVSFRMQIHRAHHLMLERIGWISFSWLGLIQLTMWDRWRFPNRLMLRCVIKMMMGLLSLSFHYNSKMRDSESYDTWEIMSFLSRSWKTGWLFPLYPCHSPPGYPDSDHNTGVKWLDYLGIWITKGLLYVSTSP
jgi:hypothetical protein